MKLFLGTLTVTLLLHSSAFAESAVDLTVQGVITPRSCSITLSGNGTIDFGKISAADVKPEGTILKKTILQLGMVCEGKTLVALRPTDYRAGSSSGALGFGLGLINDRHKLGYYDVQIANPVADGVPVQPLRSLPGGIWGWEPWLKPGSLVAFTSSVDLPAPEMLESLNLDLEFHTFLGRTQGLDLSNEIPLDGAASIEVTYL